MSTTTVNTPADGTPAAPDLRMLAVADLVPDIMQPRMELEGESTSSEFRTVQGLAASIVESGVIQPLVVRALASGGYQIQSGHRRHRAATLAGLEFVPCIVVNDDGDLASKRISQISENAQRKAMTSKELALAIQELLRLGVSKGEAARRLGIHESRVTLLTKLLELPAHIQDAYASGAIQSPRAAYELDRLPRALQDQLLKEAASNPLTQVTVQEARKRWETSGGARPPAYEIPAVHPTLLAALTKFLQKDDYADTYSADSIGRDRRQVFGDGPTNPASPVSVAPVLAGIEAAPFAENGHVRLPNITVKQAQALLPFIERLNGVKAPVALYDQRATVHAVTEWLAAQLQAIRTVD